MPAPSKVFTTFADSAVDPDSPIDTTLMTGLRDNDIHLKEWLGLSYTAAQNHDHDGTNSKLVVSVADGSITTTKVVDGNITTAKLADGNTTTAKLADGNVTQGKIGSGAAGQAQLKTTTGDMSTTEIQTLTTGPGGEYGFWPTVAGSPTGGSEGYITAQLSAVDASGAAVAITIGTSLLQRFHIGENGAQTITVRQRYVQASPPYDLGDGEVPLFIFAVVSSLGVIESVWSAPDPVWANNGPTNIRADFVDAQGRAFKFERPPVSRALLLNPATRDAELAKLDAAPELIQITQAVKQADMPLIPHPFQGNNLAGKTVVLLDPVSALVAKLRDLHATGENINTLLHDNYLRIGNVPLIRSGPPGVMAMAVNWKLT